MSKKAPQSSFSNSLLNSELISSLSRPTMEPYSSPSFSTMRSDNRPGHQHPSTANPIISPPSLQSTPVIMPSLCSPVTKALDSTLNGRSLLTTHFKGVKVGHSASLQNLPAAGYRVRTLASAADSIPPERRKHRSSESPPLPEITLTKRRRTLTNCSQTQCDPYTLNASVENRTFAGSTGCASSPFGQGDNLFSQQFRGDSFNKYRTNATTFPFKDATSRSPEMRPSNPAPSFVDMSSHSPFNFSSTSAKLVNHTASSTMSTPPDYRANSTSTRLSLAVSHLDNVPTITDLCGGEDTAIRLSGDNSATTTSEVGVASTSVSSSASVGRPALSSVTLTHGASVSQTCLSTSSVPSTAQCSTARSQMGRTMPELNCLKSISDCEDRSPLVNYLEEGPTVRSTSVSAPQSSATSACMGCPTTSGTSQGQTIPLSHTDRQLPSIPVQSVVEEGTPGASSLVPQRTVPSVCQAASSAMARTIVSSVPLMQAVPCISSSSKPTVPSSVSSVPSHPKQGIPLAGNSSVVTSQPSWRPPVENPLFFSDGDITEDWILQQLIDIERVYAEKSKAANAFQGSSSVRSNEALPPRGRSLTVDPEDVIVISDTPSVGIVANSETVCSATGTISAPEIIDLVEESGTLEALDPPASFNALGATARASSVDLPLAGPKEMRNEVTSETPVDASRRPPTPAEVAELLLDQECDQILMMFPDASEHFVRDKLSNTVGKSEIRINHVCNYLLENKYPKKSDVIHETEVLLPKTNSSTCACNYFSEDAVPTHRGRLYRMAAESLLANAFPKISMTDLRRVLNVFGGNYALSWKCITDFMESQNYVPSVNGVYVLCIKRTKGTPKTINLRLLKGHRQKIPFVNTCPELKAEVEFVENYVRNRKEALDHDLAAQMNKEEYETAGQLIECGCCYGEVSFEQMVQCSDGHLFCQDCLRHYAQESVFGQGKAKLSCMTDGCDSVFPLSQLEVALPANVLEKYHDRCREEAINLADLENLVRCPGCDFAAILDDGIKVFSCLNCNKETCRYCQVDWAEHFGIPCNEMEKKDETKLRLTFEEKMTEARIRKCHKCKTSFTKIDGCNKMTCRCGAKMCYICRAAIKDYTHFCQHPKDPGRSCDKCQKCSLWTKSEEDEEQALREIRKEASEARKAEGFIDYKLIGAPDEPPNKVQKVK